MGRLVYTHSTYIDGLIPVLKRLAKEESIDSVTPGVIKNTKGRTQKLIIRVTSKIKGGHKALARKGKSVQEIFVITKINSDELGSLFNSLVKSI